MKMCNETVSKFHKNFVLCVCVWMCLMMCECFGPTSSFMTSFAKILRSLYLYVKRRGCLNEYAQYNWNEKRLTITLKPTCGQNSTTVIVY